MKKNLLVLYGLSLILLCGLNSCSQKIYLQEADKLEYDMHKNPDVRVNAFFAGDAIDYLVFELDVFNDSNLPIDIDYRNVSLNIYPKKNSEAIVLKALNKDRVLDEIAQAHRDLERERKARNIENAVNIGLSVLAIGLGQGYDAVDLFIYSADTASYLMEDARAYKLLKGSLEEQTAYVNEWVLGKSTIESGNDNSFDILFERELFDAEASFVLELDGKSYNVPFRFHILEQKVR